MKFPTDAQSESVTRYVLMDEAQVRDIVAFLESLSGPFPEQTLPLLPPAAGDLLN